MSDVKTENIQPFQILSLLQTHKCYHIIYDIISSLEIDQLKILSNCDHPFASQIEKYITTDPRYKYLFAIWYPLNEQTRLHFIVPAENHKKDLAKSKSSILLDKSATNNILVHRKGIEDCNLTWRDEPYFIKKPCSDTKIPQLKDFPIISLQGSTKINWHINFQFFLPKLIEKQQEILSTELKFLKIRPRLYAKYPEFKNFYSQMEGRNFLCLEIYLLKFDPNLPHFEGRQTFVKIDEIGVGRAPIVSVVISYWSQI